jgi:ATPase subunit of ABC transporter with duplicated ATPase domains
MSILNVTNLSHGFGDRAIFENVSFRLLKGEHIGLIGANGEGESTFFNIVTGKLMPDEGTIEWAKNIQIGYLDQHAVLEKGMTIEDVLKSAFRYLFDVEKKMNELCEKMKHIGGKAFISVNKALVTQASSAIPVVPLYITLLYKVMKESGLHEDTFNRHNGSLHAFMVVCAAAI